ncbi:hypothetical protein OG429_35955 [Streptomyces sp. NBC_00190]|uniref:hypothetical protein n=1 Tax=unclassified Streptomyces TaxID=2593676 RepID=UPI002E295FFC|nr:hypothetical protein [Streptomyces sp. NBC_00190]WSZ44189.1 hypothetical protein OG239_38420 [Streptomyces sp. NBC_00868]
MGDSKAKRQEPGKGREEQKRMMRPGQDPVHPEPSRPSSGEQGPGGKGPDEMSRRREEDRMRDKDDMNDEEL